MSLQLTRRTYDTLVDDLSAIIDEAQAMAINSYFLMGKRLVEVDQHGNATSPHGSGLLVSLSAILTKKYGTGFSVTQLQDMRRFYLAHRNQRHVVNLPWSAHLKLLTVKDVHTREMLERRMVKENVSRKTLRVLIRDARHKTEKARIPVLKPLIVPEAVRAARFFEYAEADDAGSGFQVSGFRF